MPTHSSQVLEFARRGAEVRIKELQAEIVELRKIAGQLSTPRTPDARSMASTAASTGARKRRRRLSTAARKAISERMTAYWAKRRAGKKR